MDNTIFRHVLDPNLLVPPKEIWNDESKRDHCLEALVDYFSHASRYGTSPFLMSQELCAEFFESPYIGKQDPNIFNRFVPIIFRIFFEARQLEYVDCVEQNPCSHSPEVFASENFLDLMHNLIQQNEPLRLCGSSDAKYSVVEFFCNCHQNRESVEVLQRAADLLKDIEISKLEWPRYRDDHGTLRRAIEMKIERDYGTDKIYPFSFESSFMDDIRRYEGDREAVLDALARRVTENHYQATKDLVLRDEKFKNEYRMRIRDGAARIHYFEQEDEVCFSRLYTKSQHGAPL